MNTASVGLLSTIRATAPAAKAPILTRRGCIVLISGLPLGSKTPEHLNPLNGGHRQLPARAQSHDPDLSDQPLARPAVVNVVLEGDHFLLPEDGTKGGLGPAGQCRVAVARRVADFIQPGNFVQGDDGAEDLIERPGSRAADPLLERQLQQ